MAKIGLTIGLLYVHVGFCIYHCNFSGGLTDYCAEACCEHSCCSKNAPEYSIHISGIAVSGTLIVSLLIVLFCMGIWCNPKRKRPRNDSDQLNPARTAAELPGNTSTIESRTSDVESASEIVNTAIPQTGVYSYDQTDSVSLTTGLCLETISKHSANGSASHSSEDSNIHDKNLPVKNNYLHNNT
ncbi:hypothetical protein ACJMK2_016550 [Sinanodonta woodiana]|uniref:Uncharacterized protein n=1 Tax=Sinanodonta woodiana TaxID=1069815 RepID=A0ABD3UV00_SINWO